MLTLERDRKGTLERDRKGSSRGGEGEATDGGGGEGGQQLLASDNPEQFETQKLRKETMEGGIKLLVT